MWSVRRSVRGRKALRNHHGFSLVETMVGMTIGLVTVLLITQVLSSFQSGRGSAVAGSDAQENGLFALQILSGDVRAAGAGAFASGPTGTDMTPLYNCTNACSYDVSNTTGSDAAWCSSEAAAATTGRPMATMSGRSLTGTNYTLTLPLAPVIIEASPAGVSGVIQYAAGSDVISIRSLGRFSGSVPTRMYSSTSVSAGVTSLPLDRAFGFATGDHIGVFYGTNCVLYTLSATSTADNTVSYTIPPNPLTGSLWAPTYASSTPPQVYNLGNASTGAVVLHEYSVNAKGNSLQFREVKTGNPATVAPTSLSDGIVAIKAQYGIAASADSPTVCSSCWKGTDSADWSSTWAPSVLTAANYGLIRAVRLVVVVRSGQRENNEVTSVIQPDVSLPTIDVSGQAWAANSEWKHYRYKVYTTVAPLRNVLWGGSWSNQGQ